MMEDEVESRTPVAVVAAETFPAAPEHNAVLNCWRACDVVSLGVLIFPSCHVFRSIHGGHCAKHTVKRLV
jgi:hypothetical protein